MSELLITALVMGLTGSLHCAGMCGPLMLFMPFHAMRGLMKWISITAYHVGRITMYASMGLVLHSFKSAFHPQWQQRVAIVAGVALLVMGILSFAGKRILPTPKLDRVYTIWGKLIARPGMGTLLAAGVINGLLPCGLVYMALSLSMTASTGGASVAVMYVFGLGTLPMLLAVTVLGQRMKAVTKQWVTRTVPLTLLVVAGLFIMRGLNLGIPYLSPKVAIEQKEIKASCCHKPGNRK